MLKMLEVIALILFAIVLIWPLIKAAVGNEEEIINDDENDSD